MEGWDTRELTLPLRGNGCGETSSSPFGFVCFHFLYDEIMDRRLVLLFSLSVLSYHVDVLALIILHS